MKTSYYLLYARNGAWILERAINDNGNLIWLKSSHKTKKEAEQFLTEALA